MKKCVIIFIISCNINSTQTLFAQEAWKTGEHIFKTVCKACHTIGHGAFVGPDLNHIKLRTDSSWLYAFIRSPKTLKEQGDSTALALHKHYFPYQMPDQKLSDAEIYSIIQYIERKSKK